MTEELKMRVKTYAESGEWFGRIEELVEEIEENGYEVLEANAESVTFEDDDERASNILRSGRTGQSITITSTQNALNVDSRSRISKRLKRVDAAQNTRR